LQNSIKSTLSITETNENENENENENDGIDFQFLLIMFRIDSTTYSPDYISSLIAEQRIVLHRAAERLVVIARKLAIGYAEVCFHLL